MKPEISVVSPVYGAEKIVDELVRQLIDSLEQITSNYEIILVEDGSPDNSWRKIQENCLKFKQVKGIKLSKNFGQHHAVSAGISESKGNSIVVMDCDLQDDPKDIQKLIDKTREGYDTVFTIRSKRRHPLLKRILSKLYKSLFSLLSNEEFSLLNGSLYLINRKVADAVTDLKDKPRLMGQVIRWVGFKVGYIEVKHKDRFEGKSSYSVEKLMNMVWDGWISNSDKMLRIVMYLGVFISISAFFAAILIIIMKSFIDFMTGWSSIIVAILFSTGLILLAQGVVGLYVGKIFEQTKERPLYIIDEKINFN
ncbi:MAG: glycosyltransferase [Chitinophagales bacterium]